MPAAAGTSTATGDRVARRGDVRPAGMPDEMFVASEDGTEVGILRVESVGAGEFADIKYPGSADVATVHVWQRRVVPPAIVCGATAGSPITLADGASYRFRTQATELDDLRRAVMEGWDVVAPPPNGAFVRAVLDTWSSATGRKTGSVFLAGTVTARTGPALAPVYSFEGTAASGWFSADRAPATFVVTGASVDLAVCAPGMPAEFCGSADYCSPLAASVRHTATTLADERVAAAAAAARAVLTATDVRPPTINSAIDFPMPPRPARRTRVRRARPPPRSARKQRNSRARRRTAAGIANHTVVPLDCVPGLLPDGALSPGRLAAMHAACRHYLAGYCAFGAACRHSHNLAFTTRDHC